MLKLEVGKKYRHTTGIVEIVEHDPERDHFPFIADNNLSYTASGKYLDDNVSPFDLYEEVIEMKFKIGDKLELKAKGLVQVIFINTLPTFTPYLIIFRRANEDFYHVQWVAEKDLSEAHPKPLEYWETRNGKIAYIAVFDKYANASCRLRGYVKGKDNQWESMSWLEDGTYRGYEESPYDLITKLENYND